MCSHEHKDGVRVEAVAGLAEVERNSSGYMLITQADMFSFVFVPASQRACGVPLATITAALTEYMLTTLQHYMTVDDALHELLVTLLIQDERYYQFHQYLQYQIINDSRATAQCLLDLSAKYPPAFQLALDMMFRLQALPELLQTLKARGHLIGILRLVSDRGWGPNIQLFEEPGLRPADFLEHAAQQNPAVFYWVYKFFQSRTTAFAEQDHREKYSSLFTMWFDERACEYEDDSAPASAQLAGPKAPATEPESSAALPTPPAINQNDPERPSRQASAPAPDPAPHFVSDPGGQFIDDDGVSEGLGLSPRKGKQDEGQHDDWEQVR